MGLDMNEFDLKSIERSFIDALGRLRVLRSLALELGHYGERYRRSTNLKLLWRWANVAVPGLWLFGPVLENLFIL